MRDDAQDGQSAQRTQGSGGATATVQTSGTETEGNASRVEQAATGRESTGGNSASAQEDMQQPTSSAPVEPISSQDGNAALVEEKSKLDTALGVLSRGGYLFLDKLRRLTNPSGLPARLLFLTVIFVMLAEVLIFALSIGQFRINWLNDRLDSAYIASLATTSAEGGQVPEVLREQFLATAGVNAIAVKLDNHRSEVLTGEELTIVNAAFDVSRNRDLGPIERVGLFLGQVRDALYVFVAPRDRMILVFGPPSGSEDENLVVEAILKEKFLRAAMVRHAINIFILSVIISVIAAALVYFALSRLLVVPMTRIASNMVEFGEAPEDPSRIISASGRADEIGIAERELARMQTQLAQALAEKNRLAQLGLAVSKINHDLRNMLSSAQLISDRLGSVQDPTVQRFAPKLIASLDRAIDFCNATLKFGRAAEAEPHRSLFRVDELLSEVADGLDVPKPGVDWVVEAGANVQIDADREHLYRVLNNICRNSVAALERHKVAAGQIRITAERIGLSTRLVISDNGPGVPPRAREKLFQAFQGAASPGGTGLGLAISQELIAAHGGRLALRDTDVGASFELVIPDRKT